MIHPEIKIAQRIIDKYKIIPPVDIISIVKLYADIEEEILPIDADAISINLKKAHRKPQIFLNASADTKRRKFTLAHELGHIIIPWHVGTFISYTDGFAHFTNYLYKQLETEANRFASEILLPNNWLSQQVKSFSKDPISFIKKTSKIAEMSFAATTFSTLNVLPPGYVLAILSTKNTVEHSGATNGTYTTAPSKGTTINNAREYYPLATDIYEEQLGPLKHVWWYFSTDSFEKDSQDERSWREILSQILDESSIDKENYNSVIHSINGLLGAANVKFKQSSRSEMLNALIQKFSSNHNTKCIVKHIHFNDFLIKRIIELQSK